MTQKFFLFLVIAVILSLASLKLFLPTKEKSQSATSTKPIYWIEGNTLYEDKCNQTLGLYISKNNSDKFSLSNYKNKYLNVSYTKITEKHCGIQCIKAPCPNCTENTVALISDIQEVDLTSCTQDSDCLIISHSTKGLGCALKTGFCIEESYYRQHGFSNDHSFKAVNKNKLESYTKNNCPPDLECKLSPACSYDDKMKMIGNDYLDQAKCINHVCTKVLN